MKDNTSQAKEYHLIRTLSELELFIECSPLILEFHRNHWAADSSLFSLHYIYTAQKRNEVLH